MTNLNPTPASWAGIGIAAAALLIAFFAPVNHQTADALGVAAGLVLAVSTRSLLRLRHPHAPQQVTYPIPGYTLGIASSVSAASERCVEDI